MADGLHEEIIWPPVRVFADQYCQFSSKVHNRPRYLHSPVLVKSPATQLPPLLPSHASSKPCPKSRPHAGGPGMQAVFLDLGRKSCGTGVFLPRSAGHAGPKPAKKPTFAPVLLPSRVVQALHLNMHELGLQIKPRDSTKNKSKAGVDRKMSRNKMGNEVKPSQNCVISQKRSLSPDIFLPKEWTY